MGATKVITAGAVKPQIDRQYKDTNAFQWVRETLANAYQAGATKVLYGIEPVSREAQNVFRRYVLDDGHGMNADEIEGFLNKYGGSGRTIGADAENYGYGSKVSLLPWNQFGMVVISRGSEGDISMVWMHLDADLGDYGARMFDLNEGTVDPEEDWQAVVPLDEFEEIGFHRDGINWAEVAQRLLTTPTGTVVILLGDTITQDTITGDPNRNESAKYGIVQFLNARVWELSIDVQVETPANYSDRTSWSTTQKRSADGLKVLLENLAKPTKGNPKRGLTAKGQITLDHDADKMDTQIDWLLYNGEVATTMGKSRAGDDIATPIVGVLHEAHEGLVEVYDLTAMGYSHHFAARAAMRRFSGLPQVGDRMAIIVRPGSSAEAKVFPTASRSTLRYADQRSGGKNLPWDQWTEQWKKYMPQEIQEAVNDFYSQQTPSDSSVEHFTALKQTFLDYLKETFKTVVSGSGSRPGGRAPGARPDPDSEPTGRTRGPARNRKPRAQIDGTDGTGSEGTVSGGLIEARIINDPSSSVAVQYDDFSKKALINSNSREYKRLMKFVMDRLERSGKLLEGGDDDSDPRRPLVAQAVNRALMDHISLAVTESVQEAHLDPGRKDQILSDEAMSATIRGIKHIDAMSNTAIGAALSGKKLR